MSEGLLSRLIAAGVPADLIADVARLEARAQMVEEALEGRRSSDRSRKQRERGRVSSRDVTGQGVTSAETRDSAPLDKKSPHTPKELNPPTPTNDADASFVPPAGVEPGDVDDGKRKAKPAPKARRKPRRIVGSRLSADWQPSAIEDLPQELQALIRQWPTGAYEMVVLQFRNHWLSESRAIGAKRDWPRTWQNWLMRESSSILRASRSGVDFSSARKVAASPEAAEKAKQAVAAIVERQGGESRDVVVIRAEMLRRLGEQTYESWLRPTLLHLADGRLTIAAEGRFHLDYVEQAFGDTIARLASSVAGVPVHIRFQQLKPPDRRAA